VAANYTDLQIIAEFSFLKISFLRVLPVSRRLVAHAPILPIYTREPRRISTDRETAGGRGDLSILYSDNSPHWKAD